MRIIIFTDLDGSLLNHEDYKFTAAQPALKRIRMKNIPLVMTTSKTRKEVERLQRRMGIHDPFIVENGGGIFFPETSAIKGLGEAEKKGRYYVVRLGAPYKDIRKFFIKTAALFKIRGFGDMTAAGIAGIAGLSEDDAGLARYREFTEPFWAENENDIAEIERLARREGFKIVKGGRFYHLVGSGQDKGLAVKKVVDIYSGGKQEIFTTIGVGDSENDLPMLRQVDIPVLIPRPRQDALHIELPGLVRAKEPGSRGWNEAVGCVLDNLERDISHKKP